MEGSVKYISLPAVTAPGAVKIYEGREVVQKFTDPLFGDFRVLKTGGHRVGFWEDHPVKVQKLIDAFKSGHNIKNACIYAGITHDAWLRFLAAYPAFRGIKEACEASTSFGAMNTVQEGLRTKPDLAFKYIEKRGDFNFETRKVEEEKPLQPTVNVGVQINNNLNDGAIQEQARAEAADILSEGAGEGEGAGDARVAEAVQE